MPDTLDGNGILTQAEMRGVDPGNDHKNTRRVGTRVVVYVRLSKPEGLYFRIKPSFLAICF